MSISEVRIVTANSIYFCISLANPKQLLKAVRGCMQLSSHSLLESHLVNLCNSLALCQWSNGKDLLPANHSRMSILHLVSSLGYEQLARLLMFWK